MGSRVTHTLEGSRKDTVIDPERTAQAAAEAQTPEQGFLALRQALQGFFRSHLSSPDFVDDLMQETYEQLRRWRPRGPVRDLQGYVFACARNALNQHYRRRRREQARFKSWEGGDSDPARGVSSLWQPDNSVQALLEEEIDVVVGQLPVACRIAAVRHIRDGRSYQQIAEELGVSPNRVKQHIVMALNHFRVYFAMRHVTGDANPTQADAHDSASDSKSNDEGSA